MAIDKKFVDQLAIVTSKAALASSYQIGKNDKKKSHFPFTLLLAILGGYGV